MVAGISPMHFVEKFQEFICNSGYGYKCNFRISMDVNLPITKIQINLEYV